jgi:hypothetical protein
MGILAGSNGSSTMERDARIREDPYVVSFGRALAPCSPRSSLPRSNRSTSAGGRDRDRLVSSGFPLERAVARAGALRRSGMAPPSRRRCPPLGWSGPGLASSTCGARAPPGWWLLLDGPRRRVHPGSGGRPPTAPELAPRLGPLMVAGALADPACVARRAARVRQAERLAPRRPTGSNRLRAVTARKPALGTIEHRSRGTDRPGDRHRLAPTSFVRAIPGLSRSLAPGGSRPRSRWAPGRVRGLHRRSSPGSATTSFASRRGHPKAHRRQGELRSRRRARAPPRATILRRNPCAGAIGSLRWPPSSVHRVPSARSEDQPVIPLRFVARRSFVKSCAGRREGRLQGLHPPTSWVRPPPVSGAWTFLISHGLCSPSRYSPPRCPGACRCLGHPSTGSRPDRRAPREWCSNGRSRPEGRVAVPVRSLSGEECCGSWRRRPKPAPRIPRPPWGL